MTQLIAQSLMLGIALAMDAFSVSVANAIAEPGMRRRKMAICAGVYALFQFAMPMAGWFCVREAAARFALFQRMIPWIALFLLGWIGGRMLLEGIRSRAEEKQAVRRLGAAELLAQGVATSIDALSTGFAFSSYTLRQALLAAGIIAAVTFVVCMGGMVAGRAVGRRLKRSATIFGGAILIGIGIRIFISNL